MSITFMMFRLETCFLAKFEVRRRRTPNGQTHLYILKIVDPYGETHRYTTDFRQQAEARTKIRELYQENFSND